MRQFCPQCATSHRAAVIVAVVGASRDGLSLRRWDFIFYAILGVVVTSSVQIAGVLLGFSLLVVPTVMGGRLYGDSRRQYIYTPLLRRWLAGGRAARPVVTGRCVWRYPPGEPAIPRPALPGWPSWPGPAVSRR